MDLKSIHSRVMLVAQPFSVRLHISSLPPTPPIHLGPSVSSIGLLKRHSTFGFVAATTKYFQLLLAAASNDDDFLEQQQQEETGNTFSSMLLSSPKARAVLYMAVAMALHFGGYEFARSATLALFTSRQTGFTTPAAFPLAMSMVTPVSFLFLMGYTRDLETNGPRLALRHSTLVSMLTLTCSGILLHLLSDHRGVVSQLVVGLAFVFQNSYAHLLYTQQWSFLGSVMTPTEGSRWFASIAGLSSVVAAVAGTVVSSLVVQLGLVGLLLCTSLALLASLLCADRAYAIAHTFGFDPAQEISQKVLQKNEKKKEHQNNMVGKAKDLFGRVPTLRALFCEVLSFQSLSTILNVCFVTKLRMTILDDVARAAWTGKFYSLINAISASLQFVVLPLTMRHIEPKWVWRTMPIIPLVCSVVTSLEGDASLYLLAFAFFAAKCMDYSLRGVVNEMIYVPLDFESRYVGKEIIGVFGNRLGKSGMSLILSALTYSFGNFGLRQLSILSMLASTTWMGTSWWLSGLVPKQAQAEKMVDERRKSN